MMKKEITVCDNFRLKKTFVPHVLHKSISLGVTFNDIFCVQVLGEERGEDHRS